MPISVIQRTRAIGFRSIVRVGEASIFRDSAWAASTDSHCVEAVPGTSQFLFQLSKSQTVIARIEATKQSILPFARRDGLLRGACHRAALCADPLARNDVSSRWSNRPC